MERRLAAILAIDAVGYSHLMEANEVATFSMLKEFQQQVIEPKIAAHHGRVIKVMGDGTLAAFASVVDAVECAVAIQADVGNRNRAETEDRRIEFRIGVHPGDVIVDGDELYGDGVNVAARLESLAAPGGICISRQALDHVETKLDLAFEDMGEQRVKNIARPIHAYRVQGRGGPAPKAVRRKTGVVGVSSALAAAVLIVVGAAVAWFQPWKAGEGLSEDARPAAIPLNQPSIAVLPFANMSDDPEQVYFAEGMAEDIITDLSRISGLLVIARNSSFAFKGQTQDVREVARQLNVAFVLKGAVRKIGDRIRITVQLVDANKGNYVWAQRYDRRAKDIFDLQDEVRAKVIDQLAVKLTSDEKERLAHRLTNSVEAYDLWLRGRRFESFFTKQANLQSRRLFKRAIEIDPKFAAAYASLGTGYFLAPQLGWVEGRDDFIETGLSLLERAVALDGNLPQAHWALARAVSRREIFDGARAVAELEKAISLDPNYADAYALLATVLNNTGRAEKALGYLEKAMRLNPRAPYWYLNEAGKSQYMLTRYEAAAKSFEKALERNPNVAWVRKYLIASYGQIGRRDDAEWQLEELRVLGKKLTLAGERVTTNLIDKAYRARFIEGLQKAGVPEK